MSFCTTCGRPLAEGASFCTACGAPASGAASAPAPAETSPPSPADTAATQALPPGSDQAATLVAPAAFDQTPTQVTPPVQQTAIMPPGAGGVAATPASPQGPASPPAYGPPGYGPPAGGAPPVAFGAAPPPSPGSHKKAIVIGIVIAAVAIAAALAAYFLFFSGGGSEFVGTWAPVDGSAGGVIVADDLKITLVNDDGSRIGPIPGTAKGDTLTGVLTLDVLRSAGGAVGTVASTLAGAQLVLRYEKSNGHLVATVKPPPGMSSSELQAETQELKKVTSLTVGSPSPSLTTQPTPSLSPSPTLTPTTSGSPTTTPSSSPSTDAEKNQQVVAGVTAIYGGLQSYAQANGQLYPTADQVVPGGALEPYLPSSSWPINPFVGGPMLQGGMPGGYSVTVSADRTSASVSGVLADGVTKYTQP